MDNQIGALIERMERLEKSNRVMKVIVAIAVAAMAAMTSIPQSLAKPAHHPKVAAMDVGTITTSQINLVNGNNQLVAMLGSMGNSTGLVFLDSHERWALALGTNSGGPKPVAGLAVFDGNDFLPGGGVARAAVGISTDGAGLVTLDTNSHPALVAGVAADGTGSGSLSMDSNGYARAGFGNTNQGSGFFAKDAAGVTRYVAGVTSDASKSGSLAFDQAGKLQLAAGGIGDDSASGILAFDGNGQDRLDAGFSSSNSGSGGMVVKDGNGSVIWYAPEPAGE
jgi:hypothetical protein